jgi:hypothetical protein
MPAYKFYVMELSSNGFGTPEALMKERVDLVMDAYDYLRFKNQYESESYDLMENK